MKAVYLKNFRKGLATNSSSTHSLIYRNEGEIFKDLDIFELDYYDRCTNTIAASREAKIKYVLAEIMHHHEHYLGRRTRRGFFKSSTGKRLNADCNGAIGIMRKGNAITDAQLLGLRDRGDVVSPKVFKLNL